MARTYQIGGELVTVKPGWSMNDKINARSTITFTITDVGDATIVEGATFQIFDGATKEFEGLVQKITDFEKYPNYLEYTIIVADNCAIADRRTAASVHENEVAGDIVKALITNVLADEGITQGTIEDGPTISKAVFNYIKVSQALDYLKKTTGGYIWNIDKDKKLNFYARTSNNAPFTLDDTVQHKDFKRNRSLGKYRNTQYLRGGKGRTATQSQRTPTPAPDGVSRTFVLRFGIAEEPTIELNIAGGGWATVPSADIGINGLDENKKWYWSYNSPTITQDDSETVLNSADAIRVTYIGLRNLFVRADDPSEIANRQSIESGTGIYENFAIEKSIDETDQALEYMDGLLETYGEVHDKVTFSTEEAGLEAGQLLQVNKTLYGISEKFLIESIVKRPLSYGGYEYKITALDGASIGGWEEFFKELLRESRDFAIAENEVLITLNSFTESIGMQGEIEIKVFNASYPSDTSYPGEDQYPNDEVVSEVTLND